MGLQVSHGAFDGAYSAFNRFRKFVLTSIGGSYPPHQREDLDSDRWYWETDNPFNSISNPGLKEFFCHDDCEGEISPQMCKVVADELESILPYMEELERNTIAIGHIARDGSYVQIAREFIDGCRLAHKLNEPLEFY